MQNPQCERLAKRDRKTQYFRPKGKQTMCLKMTIDGICLIIGKLSGWDNTDFNGASDCKVNLRQFIGEKKLHTYVLISFGKSKKFKNLHLLNLRIYCIVSLNCFFFNKLRQDELTQ